MKYAYPVIITWLDRSPTQSWTTKQYTKAGRIDNNCPKISHGYKTTTIIIKLTTTTTIIIIIIIKQNNKKLKFIIMKTIIKWNNSNKTIILIS